jgi:hypothetical protein
MLNINQLAFNEAANHNYVKGFRRSDYPALGNKVSIGIPIFIME